MSEHNDGGNSVITFLFGVALGAAAGLLLAPRPGRETRKRLQKWMDELEDIGEDLMDEGRDLWDEGKQIVQDKSDQIKEKVQTAKRKILD